MSSVYVYFSFFFFNDTATTEIYTLSLHDALPISAPSRGPHHAKGYLVARLHQLGLHAVGLEMAQHPGRVAIHAVGQQDRKSTRLNSSHANISYAVFCLKKKKKQNR